jgi:type II secretory pathway pseudopilin PulG
MPETQLILAPGAKAAKVCGILAIVFAFTCVGIPVAIVLGIVAIVKHGTANRLAKAEPWTYEPVPATGLVTGIIGLVLILPMLFITGIMSAIAIPALLGQRERAREFAVQANLDAARRRAETEVLAIHARAPGQVPSQDAILRALAADPGLQRLRNPITPSAPAFQRGTSGLPGTVMVYGDQEQAGGVTTWSLQFRAVVRRGGQERALRGEVITHTQEHVQGRTEDGWEVVQPPTPEH